MKHIDDYLDKIDKLIGTKIYSLRLDRNMTQAELAKKLGISGQQIQKYETAKNKINASRLALVSKVLDKDVAYFYESA
jgi:transcriptional regulator with XRE-family HTH domain